MTGFHWRRSPAYPRRGAGESALFHKPEHQARILEAYSNLPGSSELPGRLELWATIDEIAAQNYGFSIPLYVKRVTANGANNGNGCSLPELLAEWEREGRTFWQELWRSYVGAPTEPGYVSNRGLLFYLFVIPHRKNQGVANSN